MTWAMFQDQGATDWKKQRFGIYKLVFQPEWEFKRCVASFERVYIQFQVAIVFFV